MLHDFAITKDYIIFPIFPLTCNIARLFNSENIYKWEHTLGCYFGIMPRFGKSEDCIWIHQDEPGLAVHIVSAYQEGDLVILDACYSNDIPDNADGFTPDNEETFPMYLTRWVFDVKKKIIVSKNKIDNVSCEFPKIDERYTGDKYNHVYVASTLHSKWYGHEFDAITHYDIRNHTKQVHNFGKDTLCVEPLFVPRNATSPEGDGFLLVFAYNKLTDTSDLVILDANHVDKEPLGIVKIPHRVPFTFHAENYTNFYLTF